MDLDLNDDQQMIQQSVRSFATERVAPNAYAWDKAAAIEPAIFTELAELGLMGMHVAAELDVVTGCIALEELARQDASLAAIVASHNISALVVEELASGEQRGAYVVADGQLVIGGAAADVFVRSGEPVERSAATVEAAQNLLGLRAAALAHVSFEGTAHRLAALDDRWNVATAAVLVGVGRGALEEARAYALDRKQFKKPIADFQAIQWMLADVAMEVDAARMLTHAAASTIDHDGSAERPSAEARMFAAGAAVSAAMKAIQIFGGNGFVREFPVERYLRDAKTLSVLDGTVDRHKQTVAREILRTA